MATRFYLRALTTGLPAGTLPNAEQSSQTADVNFEADQTTNRRMHRKRGTSVTNLQKSTNATTSLVKYYIARWVSDPINQTSIAANTWTFNNASQQLNANNWSYNTNSATRWINIYVWKPSDGTKVGTIYDGTLPANGNTVNGSIASYQQNFSGSAVNGLTAGDAVIVIELWANCTQSSASANTVNIYFDGTTVYPDGTNNANTCASFVQTPENLTVIDDYVETELFFHAAASGVSGTLPSAEQSAKTSIKNVDAQTVNRSMDTSIGASQATLTLTSNATVSSQTYYFTKFVSPVLWQTSIEAGAWQYNFATRESNVNANFPVTSSNKVVAMSCYAWKPSNGTKYANIKDGNTDGATVTEGSANQERSQEVEFLGSAVSSLVAGDVVIVFEVWFTVVQGSATAYTDDFFYDGTTKTAAGSTVSNHASLLRALGMPLVWVKPPTLITISEPSITFDATVARFKKGIKAISDSVDNLADSIVKKATKNRSISETSLSLGDSVGINVIRSSIQRSITEDALTLGDSVTRKKTGIRTISEAALSFADSVLKKKIAIIPLSYTLPLDDSVTRFKKGIKAISDGITGLADSILKIAFKPRATSDSVPFTDNVAKMKISPKSVSDSLTLDDTIAKLRTAIKAISEPAISFLDSIVKVALIKKTLTDDLPLTDQSTRMKKAIKPISDSLPTNDSIVRKAFKFISISDNTIFSDSVTRFKKAIKALSDSVVFDDLVSGEKLAGLIERSINDTVTFTDDVIRKKLAYAVINETINFGDSIVSKAYKFITILETIVFGDSVSKQALKKKTISDSVSTNDTISKKTFIIRALSDSITFLDDIIGEKLSALKQRTINDTVNLIDSVIGNKKANRSISENSLSFLDNIVKQVKRALSISDSITFNDSVLGERLAGIRLRFINETINFIDTVSSSKKANRTLSDTVSFTDNVIGKIITIISILETIIFTDNVTRIKKAKRTITDSVIFTSAISKKLYRFKNLIESILLNDVVVSRKQKTITINEESFSFDDLLQRAKLTVRLISNSLIITSIVNVLRKSGKGVDQLLEMHPHEIVFDYIRDNWITSGNEMHDFYLLPTKDKILFQDFNGIGDYSVSVKNVTSNIVYEMTSNEYVYYRDIVAIKVITRYYPDPDKIRRTWHIRTFIEYLIETADLEDQGISNIKLFSVAEDSNITISSNTYIDQNVTELTIFAKAEYTLQKERAS